jgi:hypothetical protein
MPLVRTRRPPRTARGFAIRAIDPQPVLPPEQDDENERPVREAR